MNKRIIIPVNDKEQLEVFTVYGRFDDDVARLATERLLPPTTEELAEARVLDAKARSGWRKSHICTIGSWAAENFTYLPNGDILVASRDYNPILENPEVATNAHRNGKEFYLDSKVVKELKAHAEKDAEKAIKSGVLYLPRKEVDHISVGKLDERALGVFLFRKQAKPYGQLCGSADISAIPVYTEDADYAKGQEQAFGQALWVDGLGKGSTLKGCDLNWGQCGGGGRIFGLRRFPAAANEPETENYWMTALEAGKPFVYKGIKYAPQKK